MNHQRTFPASDLLRWAPAASLLHLSSAFSPFPPVFTHFLSTFYQNALEGCNRRYSCCPARRQLNCQSPEAKYVFTGPRGGKTRRDGDSAKFPEMPGAPDKSAPAAAGIIAQFKETRITERKRPPPSAGGRLPDTREKPTSHAPFVSSHPCKSAACSEGRRGRLRNGVIAELALDFSAQRREKKEWGSFPVVR